MSDVYDLADDIDDFEVIEIRESDATLELARRTLVRGGGVIAGPQHLGIFVGDKTLSSQCPPGWIFVENTESPEILRECIISLREGKRSWPDKIDNGTPLGKPK